MGITYACDHTQRLVVSVWKGKVTAEEWFATLDTMFRDPNYREAFHQLVDVSLLSSDAHFSADDIQHAITLFRLSGLETSGRKIAVLAPKQDIWQKINDQIYARRFRSAALFNEVHTACLWLEVDAETVKSLVRDLRSQP